jgi:hypothetical protein
MKVEIDADELFKIQNDLRNARIEKERLEEEFKAFKQKFSKENIETDVKMAAEYLAGEVINTIAEKLGFNKASLVFKQWRYDLFVHNRHGWFIGDTERADIEVGVEFYKDFKTLIVGMTKLPERDWDE